MKLAIALLVLVLATTSAGAVDKFAVIIGNNTGGPQDVELRYAHDDARKVHDVLTSLGGFLDENVVVLEERSADDVRRALITINDRIRTRTAPTDSMLLVYYSGHATAEELHVGRSTLPLSQLESLVRGSAATMRIMILDSCRSGSLTRVKGGEKAPKIALAVDDKLAGEGVVFLTSSSANEDAQESDAIRGSYFTHYLVSALLGAGDANGDGGVSLEEAYRSAYDATLRASSQTLTLQHPTFHFDVRGHGDLVITRIANGRTNRGQLVFPTNRTYLVLRGDRDGAVVAEVSTYDKTRRISVAPGRYFIRGRDSEFALEGGVEIAAGGELSVEDGLLRRVEYARLVRKGLGPASVTSLRGGYLARSPVADGEGLCQGGFAGVERNAVTWVAAAQLGACRTTFDSDVVRATSDELAGEVRLGRAWDIGRRVTVVPAIALGGSLFHQTFETRGVAPPRWIAAGHLGVATSVLVEMARGYHVIVDVDAGTYLLQQRIDDHHDALHTTFVVRGTLGIGKYL